MKKTKKKIAFLIGTLGVGGSERVISILSNELIEEFDVTIITFSKTIPFYFLDNRVKLIYCFENIKKSKTALESITLNYRLSRKLTYLVKVNEINLLIGFITSANILATIAAKLNKIPCIISERHDPHNNDNTTRFWHILRKLVYPWSDQLVVQTNKVKAVYENMINSKKITVIPNPISQDLTAMRKITTRTSEKIILTVGRLNNDKRQHILIEAFKKLNLTDWKVLIIGNGPNKQKNQDLIKSLGLSSQVKIKSDIKDIFNYYNQASIFVFTSKAEGFPNALLEAMHFGLPCISTDCNYGPSDIIDNGENGFLITVDGNTEDELVSKISELVANADLRQKFSENALESTEKYRSNKISKEWIELIYSLDLNRVKKNL